MLNQVSSLSGQWCTSRRKAWWPKQPVGTTPAYRFSCQMTQQIIRLVRICGCVGRGPFLYISSLSTLSPNFPLPYLLLYPFTVLVVGLRIQSSTRILISAETQSSSPLLTTCLTSCVYQPPRRLRLNVPLNHFQPNSSTPRSYQPGSIVCLDRASMNVIGN